MIFDMRAITFWAFTINCDFAFSMGTFTPELGMLMAESLVRGSGAETLSYAGVRTRAGGVFLVNGTADRLYAEPIDFANRLNVMRGFFTSLNVHNFDTAIERFNTTCIDPNNVTAYYTVDGRPPVGMAQAGILSVFMSMRAKVCGYSSAQIIAFAVSQIKLGKAEVEHYSAILTATNDVLRCWSQRLDFAIRRLSESADPLSMGFLTMDTCVPGLRIPHVVLREPVTIAVSAPLNYFDPGMVDVAYPARTEYQTGNFSRGAWLIAPQADAAYASVWFHFMKGYDNANATWDLFSIQDRFKLSLKRNFGRDKLLLSSACGDEEASHVNFQYTSGWRFVSVAIDGNIAVIRYEDRSWVVRAPFSADCEDTSASLGPRLNAPWDGKQAEKAIIRFYDFKVSDNPETQEDLSIVRNQLMELGTETPIVCNPRNGNERRDGLKACYPGPVVRVQYVYDAQARVVAPPAPEIDAQRASAEGVSADVPVKVEEKTPAIPVNDSTEFGQREFLIITGLGLLSSFLIISIVTWYVHRSFKHQLNLLRKQVQEISRLVDESEATQSSGSPAQASASGGLNV